MGSPPETLCGQAYRAKQYHMLGFSKEGMENLLSFIRLAIPSALMVCLEFWSYEFLVLMSGLFPNPNLDASMMSISLNTSLVVFRIPFGFGSAVRCRETTGCTNCNTGCDIPGHYRGPVTKPTCSCCGQIPFYVTLCLIDAHLLLHGLWMGITCGSGLQALLLLAITMSTNWEQARMARDRVNASSVLIECNHQAV
ncbi:Protein detoxification 17 [Vitis vinifera]|uniref:Protein detoxification 17 n=1 Tax=Vitis vinifera TaxID=29760 RepID=A0A438EZ96_VITVI|nr:Protein detoxification 17 [Vitis vinifera]